jgi:hypothetical protein
MTLLAIGTGLLTGLLSPLMLTWLPAGFERPVLALELVDSTIDFDLIVQQRDPAGGWASTGFWHGTLADFAFIAAYGLLWGTMLRAGSRWQLPAVACVAIAVLADGIENAGIMAGLQGVGRANADLIRHSAEIKWAALGIAFLALVWQLWPETTVSDWWQIWRATIGLAYGYAGVLSLIGVVAYRPLIERTALPTGIALLMQIPLFWHEHHIERRRT